MRWRSVGYEWAAVLLLLGVLLAIQYFRPEWTGFEFGPTTVGGKIYVAIDGDSFRAGDTEIRLHGIDAPEYRQTCRSAAGETQPCGRLARDQLSRLIRGQTVSCRTLEQDRYGRQVSVCKVGGVEINREMVRLGWAIAYRRHAVAYVGAEREAKAARRGIWAWRFEMPEDYRRSGRLGED